MERLARFRADPQKLRILIRRTVNGKSLLVRIVDRTTQHIYVAQHSSGASPRDIKAHVYQALAHARDLGVPGIDLDLQWSYPHPFPAQGST